MIHHLKAQVDLLESRLSPEDKARLRAIHAPTVVCVQPDDARRGMCVMPDGEIRSYGKTDKNRTVYYSSRNGGLDWTAVELPEDVAPVLNYAKLLPGRVVMGASSRVPWSGRYVTFVGVHKEDNGGREPGTWVMLSDIGPGDENPRMFKVDDEVYGDIFQPQMLEETHRIITTVSIDRDGSYGPAVFYSDDNGETWTKVNLNPTPRHTVVYPHLGVRWQNNGSEPNLTVLPNGRMMLLARTSLDYFYLYYSDDNGETWTDGEPSRFHATLTTPFLLRLHDGRVAVFWNNTRPLAEVDHSKTVPPVGGDIVRGRWEDVFTNRDANHAAITENGVDWIGFREMFLNVNRNACDFRTNSNGDNSVHQFQAIELPYGKVLVAFGQNAYSRRTVIFDLDWLYETQNAEDFRHGLRHVTTHLFVRSISGAHPNGHCAWNRTNGALLMPDPAGSTGEALQICRVRDKRLVSELQGAVWNFPKAYRGEITLGLYLAGEGIHVRLCDHWMNAGDPDAGMWANFDFTLNGRTLPVGEWVTVIVRFDTDAGMAEVFCGERKLFDVRMQNPAPDGLTYVHLQTAAATEDFGGVYVNKISCAGK